MGRYNTRVKERSEGYVTFDLLDNKIKKINSNEKQAPL